jgi:hypothetical protein
VTIQDIKELIDRAEWFRSVGSYEAGERQFALTSLQAWDRSDRAANDQDALIAVEMDWLPSARDQDDPIHGSELIDQLAQGGAEYKATVLAIYKAALHSLRNVNNKRLRAGPNDFTPAAVGAALFCTRMATIEILANKQGFWCELLRIYSNGYWPCGLTPDGCLVVY